MTTPFTPPTSDPASLGHLFHVRLNDTSLDETDIKVLEELRPIGVQVTNINFVQDAPYSEWLETYSKLIEDVHARIGREKIFVTIDHEGGRIHRPPAPITRFPAALEYCNFAAEVGAAFAEELSSIGINLLFGPSADIHSNPNNPVIGPRAFATDPQAAATCVVAFLKALEENGVVGCVKHFPGHGDTSTDSHYDLPVLPHTYDVLKERELVPFRAAIEAGISTVMTAHILFPEFDSTLPATLSPTIIRKILREDLGFQGLVITDDLDMEAIRSGYTLETIAASVLPAGCDLFLLNHEPIRGIKMAKEIFRLYEEGSLPEQILTEATERIYYVLNKCKKSEVRPLSEDVFLKHKELVKKIDSCAK